ncbi:MAG TPA: hypothetical protein VG144_13680 [Gaiellaceae bacterium]|nr:hypothetical protein [Gaiellaceae bacterium]
MRPTVSPKRVHPAAAGALAATVWGVVEPLDQRLFRSDYSDIALLGKAVTRGRGWRPIGFALHAVNGALFGLAYDAVRRRAPVEQKRLALAMALAEHFALYPLSYFVDRFHPARGERGVPPLLTNGRAFGQATVRHALFGAVLGLLTEAQAAGSRGGPRRPLRRHA